MGKGSGVPKGWYGCPPMGKSIIAGKFIVFKTPLAQKFDGQISPAKRFPPEAIFDYVRLQNKRIGLWIDFTNTTRYYPSSAVEAEGIQYVKIPCPGHGTIPALPDIDNFMSTVMNYTENQPINDDSLIAVHCSHGLNRTGFFICTYLTLYCGYPVRTAIATFNQARPPGICRQLYLDHLIQAHSWKTSDTYEPRLIANNPEWLEKTWEEFHEEDQDGQENEIQVQGQEQKSLPLPPLPPFEFVDSPTFFPPNYPRIIPVEPEKATEILREIQALVPNPLPPNEIIENELPLRETTVLTEKNLPLIGHNHVLSAISFSSVRYLIFIKSAKEVYFVDGFFTVFSIDGNFTFPRFLNFNENIGLTLLDVKIVMEPAVRFTFNPDQEQVGTNYVIQIEDIILFDGLDVTQLSQRGRLTLIKSQILQPRMDAIRHMFLDPQTEFLFSISLARHTGFAEIPKLLHLSHKLAGPFKFDGFVFKPTQEPYTPGPSIQYLKWCTIQTVNFRVKLITPNLVGLLVAESGSPFTTMDLPIADLRQPPNDGEIIEAKFNHETQKWEFCSLKSSEFGPSSIHYVQEAMTGQTHLADNVVLNQISKMKSWKRMHNGSLRY